MSQQPARRTALSRLTPQPDRTALSRRGVVHGLVAGVGVIAFDPLTRSWITAGARSPHPDARAADAPRPHDTPGAFAHVPPLDGTLLTDPAALDADADDFGHIVHRRPAAVLRPGSVADVVAMVRFCNAHGIPLAARGQGHGTNGQAQVAGGLIIETSPFDSIGPVTADPDGTGSVTVGAGAVWSAVVRATTGHGLTPPVFTDYLELSVGGTLSVGGLGGQSHLHGAQVDNVSSLTVVTGAGDLVTCSPTRSADLFHAVLAGLGQCAVIVSATLRLVTAPVSVRHYLLPYTDLDVFLDDQRRLAADDRFAYVEGSVGTDAGGAYTGYVLEAVAYGPPAGPEPDDAALLSGLRYDASGAVTAETLPYLDFLDRLAAGVAALQQAGLWAWSHPWLNVLLPGDRAAALSRGILDGLAGQEIGPGGVVLLYPLVRARLHAPLLRMPDDPVPYLLAVLWTLDPADPSAIAARTAANHQVYETVRAAGGTQYPVGSIPMSAADWRAQYGRAWPWFASVKHRYDPNGLLAPGQNVFPRA
ncbi:FAD-binding protein [Actinacidiphila sp. DG2A-62]|uniref:FAD-binding protein n=1 Tax=Actinacidiphila sp. DG2A-62 TaxID=3108821 RepID=UPI002DBAD2F1|nr:FAD-binding protein [Actinacidiphila sp. DG2A-62]MEC3998203.1 FAD-binding protein [Actinacidiphila sp. DG2A-62]